MLCSRCGVTTNTGQMYCPECRETVNTDRVRNIEILNERRTLDKRRTLVLYLLRGLVVVLMIGGFIVINLTPIQLKTIKLESSDGGQEYICPGNNPCVTVYLAPWCPACKSAAKSLPEMRNYITNNSDLDFVVISGSSSKKALEDYSRNLGVPSLYDPSGKIYDEASLKGVPSVLAINHTGKVLGKTYFAQGDDIQFNVEVMLKNLGLKDHLRTES